MESRVDVFVPCYRYGHFLEECVESVLAQEGVDLRVLILDDASPDNTQDVGQALAARDKRVTYRRHDANKGHIATYNEGIDWADGDSVLLLSADDYLLPGALFQSSELLRSEPNVGFTFGKARNLMHDGSFAQTASPVCYATMPPRHIFSGPEFIRTNGARNIVPTPTAVVRTTLQKHVGGYNSELPHSGDMEMWLRLASHAAVGFVNVDQAVYRLHNSNMSLIYFADCLLPDLQQRKRALEILFSHSGVHLLDNPELRDFLIEDLAIEAVRRAGIAFNQHNHQAVKAISSFALELDPQVRWSLPWAKLTLKKILGSRNWSALNAALRGSLRERS